MHAVAERAGVNERTVYRHFANEKELRDAVMPRLEADAGVELDGLTLDGLADFTARLLDYVSTFPFESRSPDDPTLQAAHTRLRETLLGVVKPSTCGWPTRDQAIAAAVLDVLWSVMSYERLVVDWELEPADAIRGITWVMGLVEDAIRDGRRPRAT